MPKKFTITLIICAAIFVLAAAGFIYGIATDAGNEGMLVVEGRQLHWNKLYIPITCYYDEETISIWREADSPFSDDSDVQKYLAVQYIANAVIAYNKSAAEYNKLVGVKLFYPCTPWLLTEIPKNIPGAVRLHVEAGYTEKYTAHPGGRTEHKYSKHQQSYGQILSAVITADSEQITNERMWRHEQGHILGLAHDNLQGSWMYKSLAGRSGAKLTTGDIATLQKFYK